MSRPMSSNVQEQWQEALILLDTPLPARRRPILVSPRDVAQIGQLFDANNKVYLHTGVGPADAWLSSSPQHAMASRSEEVTEHDLAFPMARVVASVKVCYLTGSMTEKTVSRPSANGAMFRADWRHRHALCRWWELDPVQQVAYLHVAERIRPFRHRPRP